MESKKCFIIAEVGVNHNGDEQLAYELIDVAKNAGADAVKFQTFKSHLLVQKNTPTAEYQKTNSGETNQHDMLKKMELDANAFRRIKKYCDKINIKFISTPFDLESVDLLDDIGVDIFKIGSGDLTNYQLLKNIAQKGKKVILSTGMSSLSEVNNAVKFITKYMKSDKLVLLHCISSYPTKNEETNLLAISTMKKHFKTIPIGFSDHTHGYHAAIIATTLGANYIEKHFTLDQNMEGPDHKASLSPSQLHTFIKKIRETNIMLGNGIKRCMPSEESTKILVRRSIAVNKKMSPGTIIKETDIICLRPATHIPATEFENIINQTLTKQLNQYDFI